MAVPTINKDECTACGACVGECPVEAIEIVDDKANIDAAKCSECGACVDACPTAAITVA